MSAEIWQTLGTIAALLCVGAYNAWRTIRAERKADEARRHAVVVAKGIEPVSNGFASEVKAQLARIEQRTEQTHGLMVDHLSAHADSDLNRKLN